MKNGKTHQRPIGIFDSGVGGLTVLKEITARLPNENIIYLGDTARVPYGPRALDEVKEFVLQIAAFLQSFDTKLIVIACNTGTAAGLQEARKMFDVPVIGVIEPGVRLAVENTNNGKIGIIGTAGTINSMAYEKALRAIDDNLMPVSLACPNFVSYVESGIVHGEDIYDEVASQLRPLKEAGIDSLILGCTHYPLLEHLIEDVMGERVSIISSAKAMAIEVESVLRRIDSVPENSGKLRFFSTADAEGFRKIGSRFLGRDIDNVDLVTVGDLEKFNFMDMAGDGNR